MLNSEEEGNENYRIIIYHGHIHIISENDENQNSENRININISKL
ncbi:MAG: hypothetical protein ACFFCV_15910 [Promethearchaeota archaeon]